MKKWFQTLICKCGRVLEEGNCFSVRDKSNKIIEYECSRCSTKRTDKFNEEHNLTACYK